MAQSTPTPPWITDPNSHDEIQKEMKEMKAQIQTILHALNIGSDHDSGQSSKGGNDHLRPEESTRPVLARATSSTSENETGPAVSNDILGIIGETQRQLAQALNQTSRPLPVHSSGDTAAAIYTFEGNQRESLKDWLEEIDRAASLANWTPSLICSTRSLAFEEPPTTGTNHTATIFTTGTFGNMLSPYASSERCHFENS